MPRRRPGVGSPGRTDRPLDAHVPLRRGPDRSHRCRPRRAAEDPTADGGRRGPARRATSGTPATRRSTPRSPTMAVAISSSPPPTAWKSASWRARSGTDLRAGPHPTGSRSPGPHRQWRAARRAPASHLTPPPDRRTCPSSPRTARARRVELHVRLRHPDQLSRGRQPSRVDRSPEHVRTRAGGRCGEARRAVAGSRRTLPIPLRSRGRRREQGTPRSGLGSTPTRTTTRRCRQVGDRMPRAIRGSTCAPSRPRARIPTRRRAERCRRSSTSPRPAMSSCRSPGRRRG